MKNISGNYSIILLFFASIIMSSCSGDSGSGSLPVVSNTNFEAVEPFSFEVPIGNHTLFSLTGINGEINITGDAGANSATITGIKRVLSESTQDAEAHMQDLKVNVQDLANEVRVETIQPADTGGRVYIVNYVVTLPGFLKNHVNSINGIVTLDSIENDVSVLNLNGNVVLTNVVVSASVNLLSGKVEGAITLPLNGVIDMKTLTGDISLDIPVNTSGELSASVTIGKITAINLLLQNEVNMPAFLSGTLGGGQGSITLETVQLGNITVTGIQ